MLRNPEGGVNARSEPVGPPGRRHSILFLQQREDGRGDIKMCRDRGEPARLFQQGREHDEWNVKAVELRIGGNRDDPMISRDDEDRVVKLRAEAVFTEQRAKHIVSVQQAFEFRSICPVRDFLARLWREPAQAFVKLQAVVFLVRRNERLVRADGEVDIKTGIFFLFADQLK